MSWLERNRRPVLIILAALLAAGAIAFVVWLPAAGRVEIVLPPPTATAGPTITPGPLRVYVCGAVARPDVYLLAAGSIVKDALLAAGGSTEDADLAAINLARALRDQEQVCIPFLGQTPAPATDAPMTALPPATAPVRVAPVSTLPAYPLNLNTASLEELDTLPGIGPTLAGRIIAYRPYRAIEELLNVPGIGPATFDKVKDKVAAP